MPVTKQKIAVQDTRSVQMVSAGQTPNSAFGDLLKVGASVAAAQADAYGRAFAAENEKKAILLAKQQTITMTAKGAPKLPEQTEYAMGAAVQATYDSTMNDRFVHQMGIAIRNQVDQAYNANQYDLDAFTIDAEDRLSLMKDDIPPEFIGAFEQVALDKFIEKTSTVANAQARLDMKSRSEMFPSMVEGWMTQLENNVALGFGDRVSGSLDAYVERIFAQPDHVVSMADKLKYQQQLYQRVGIARASTDLNLDQMNSRQLQQLYQAVIDPTSSNGEFEEQTLNMLKEYFPSVTGNYRETDSWDAKAQAAFSTHIYRLLNEAYTREGEARRHAEEAQFADDVVNGYVPESKQAKDTLTAILQSQLSTHLVDANGNPQKLDANLWLSGKFADDPEARRKAIAQMKASGFVDTSLQMAMQGLANSQDPADYEALFLVYRDLIEAPNRDEKVIDFSDKAFDNIRVMFDIVGDLHGDGAENQEKIKRAIEIVDASLNREWSDDHYFHHVTKDMDIGNGYFRKNAGVNKENFRERLDEWMGKQIGNRFGSVGEEEKQVALRLFEYYTRANVMNKDNRNDTAAALEFALQSLEGRYVETEYMETGADGKSAYAPEKFYSKPVPKTFWGTVKEWARKKDGAFRKEFYENNNPFKLLGASEDWWLDMGSDRMLAEPFDLLADKHIRNFLGENGLEQYNKKWDLLVPGRDYTLEYNPASGTPPTYFVTMVDQELGMAVQLPDFVLDVREDWNELMRYSDNLEIATGLAKAQLYQESNLQWAGSQQVLVKSLDELIQLEMEKLYAQ